MRNLFASELYNHMQQDERIVLITADLGYGILDRIRSDFHDRFFNIGAAEVCAVGVGVGMALSGKIPFVYSIPPFLLWRAAEVIRIYVNHEQIPVKLVGSGRDDNYKHDGFSHDAQDTRELFWNCWKNITAFYPNEKYLIPGRVKEMVEVNKPFYLNLER